jgi:hypothetical protein
MEVPLTYEALTSLEVQRDLTRRFHKYVPLLYNRAHLAPQFEWARILEPRTDFVAMVVVSIYETIRLPLVLRTNSYHMELFYGIFSSGAVVTITEPNAFTYGAQTAYQQPVEEWINAIKQRLLEEASKRRIQARAQALKEDLIAAVWAPARLKKRLEEGGWDAVEAFE